jgi:hypothetical protein
MHEALVRADDAWAAVLAEDPEGWVVFTASMGAADDMLLTLRDPILEGDAAAYVCLKERQSLVDEGRHRDQVGSCFPGPDDAPDPMAWTCSGEHWPVLTRHRIGPTLRRGRWVVNGEGDCVPEDAYVLQLTRRNQVTWTGYLQPGDPPWQGQAIRRKPVAAGLVGLAVAGAAVSGAVAWQAHRGFLHQRASFHGQPYTPADGADFQADMEGLKDRQQWALVATGVFGVASFGAAAFYVVEW